MKRICLIYAFLLVLLTGCEEKVTGLKYSDGYLEIYNEAELRYVSEVSQKNALNPEPLMTIDGIAIPFEEANLRFMNDVEITDSWVPIAYGYKGSFKNIDGNNHTVTFKISDLDVKEVFPKKYPEFLKFGIFDRLDYCEIKNLTIKGEIGLTNNQILEKYHFTIGALAGELQLGVTLNNVTNSANISFKDKTGATWLMMGGVTGELSSMSEPIEFISTIKNEGKLQAEGCAGTEIGGISAQLSDNIVFSPNSTLENKGGITANLSNSKDDCINAIGGVVGWCTIEKIQSDKGGVTGMSNSGNLLILVNGTPADFSVGGVCGKFGDSNRLTKVVGMENSGNIEVSGNNMGQFCSIGGVIGYAGSGLYHKLVNNGKITVSQPGKGYIGGLIGDYGIGIVSTMFSCNKDSGSGYIPFKKTELGPFERKCPDNH